MRYATTLADLRIALDRVAAEPAEEQTR